MEYYIRDGCQWIKAAVAKKSKAKYGTSELRIPLKHTEDTSFSWNFWLVT